MRYIETPHASTEPQIWEIGSRIILVREDGTREEHTRGRDPEHGTLRLVEITAASNAEYAAMCIQLARAAIPASRAYFPNHEPQCGSTYRLPRVTVRIQPPATARQN